MWLIPYKRYVLDSRFNAAELRHRFESVLDDAPSGSILANGHVYRGDVTDGGFRLRRRIRRQNAYLPLVVGTFRSSGTRTRVHVAVLVDGWFLAIFALIFAGLAVLALLDGQPGTGAMLLVLFVVVHALFYTIGYLPERMWAIDDVRQLCDAYLPAAE